MVLSEYRIAVVDTGRHESVHGQVRSRHRRDKVIVTVKKSAAQTLATCLSRFRRNRDTEKTDALAGNGKIGNICSKPYRAVNRRRTHES